MSPEEADHIIDVAEYVGFAKSDIHLDPVAKQHGKTIRSTEGKLRGVQPQARQGVSAQGGATSFSGPFSLVGGGVGVGASHPQLREKALGTRLRVALLTEDNQP